MSDEVRRWRELLRNAEAARPPAVRVLTPLQPVRGTSHPVACDCDDDRQYIVKGSQVMRSLNADHIVGRLGEAIGAPVPRVQLVDVSPILVTAGSMLSHFQPGIGHGSQFIPGCGDSRYVQYPRDEDNAERFAVLAVLYGWADADDRQFLYSTMEPHHVYSVDHGAFFTGGSEWSPETLRVAHDADVDRWLVTQVGVTRGTLQAAMFRLRDATNDVIAHAVMSPPDEWGMEQEERIALARYLAARRDSLLAMAPSI